MYKIELAKTALPDSFTAEQLERVLFRTLTRMGIRGGQLCVVTNNKIFYAGLTARKAVLIYRNQGYHQKELKNITSFNTRNFQPGGIIFCKSHADAKTLEELYLENTITQDPFAYLPLPKQLKDKDLFCELNCAPVRREDEGLFISTFITVYYQSIIEELFNFETLHPICHAPLKKLKQKLLFDDPNSDYSWHDRVALAEKTRAMLEAPLIEKVDAYHREHVNKLAKFNFHLSRAVLYTALAALICGIIGGVIGWALTGGPFFGAGLVVGFIEGATWGAALGAAYGGMKAAPGLYYSYHRAVNSVHDAKSISLQEMIHYSKVPELC